MEILENLNEIGNKIRNIDFGKLQQDFLESKIGQVTNFAINEGLKYVLPDFIEDEVIEIKDTMLKEGLEEGINSAINKAVDLGKTAIGVFTGNFDSVLQAQNAIKEGGVIDGISDAIDYTVKKLKESKVISKDVAKLITSGKKTILNGVEKNIKNEFLNENKSLNNLEKYINNWENKYSEHDLAGLKREFNKIVKEENNILPIKNIVEKINTIKNIHELINNSTEFNFDPVYLELSENLK